MDYIDVQELYQEFIAVYCRVSTAGQDIDKQIQLAVNCIPTNNIDTEKVKYFLDDNVSANKLSTEHRPEFQNLLLEIYKKRVKTILVQSRDRLARNFYEYVELVKTLYKYNVNIIFTDTSQPPFSQVLSLEALYGIFPQFDGRNIAHRTALARKHYPNKLFGFETLGKKNTKKYIPDTKYVNEIKSLFYSVININSSEELFQEFHNNFFKGNQKILSCLKNEFYSGHIKIQNEYILLPHVEPIISLDDYLKVQVVLSKYEQEIKIAIAISSNNGIKVPVCSKCKSRMNFRQTKLGKSGYYVCSKNHHRIDLEVTHFNQLVSEHLIYVLDKISIMKIKKDVFTYLCSLEKRNTQELGFLQNRLKEIHREITDIIGSEKITRLKRLGEQSKFIKEKMVTIHTDSIKIADTRSGINSFVAIVKNRVTNELQNYQIEYLVNLLFSKIEVSSDALIYHITFGKYIERNEACNECRA